MFTCRSLPASCAFTCRRDDAQAESAPGTGQAAGKEGAMSDPSERIISILDRPSTEAPAVFLTACRNGTGGHRIEVLTDRIVTHDGHGGTSQLRFDEIESALAFETTVMPPAFGVRMMRRDDADDVCYLFSNDTTRRAFWCAVGRRMRPDGA
jgi:hypothetical protein